MSFIEAKSAPPWPVIIQGGMGVGISNWKLARAVAVAGQKLDQPVLGVVSGTGVEGLLARRLQDGDPGGDMQRALAAFPFPKVAGDILDKYFHHVSKPPSAPYRNMPKPGDLLSNNPLKARKIIELSLAANFVEVWLAKEGHSGPVGINHLEKIQLLHLPRLYGAMLAGVDYVLEGAGIPDQVPGVLDRLANQEPAQYKVNVIGSREGLKLQFDPTAGRLSAQEVSRPRFLAVIASDLLAKLLVSHRVSGYVDGFIVEGPTAGGHNAPSRNKGELNDRGEPVYGEKDLVNLGEIMKLGRPFWLAGSYGNPEKFRRALELGANGIQVGTVFALCDESGMRSDLKQRVRQLIEEGLLDILTSVTASPTGFPFKVVQAAGTLSEAGIYEERVRRCSLGHLVELYKTTRGATGVRCSAEPEGAYAQKGGDPKDTEGSMCLCNGLLATAGYPQRDKLGEEAPVITLGDDVNSILGIPKRADGSYTALDVLRHLLGV